MFISNNKQISILVLLASAATHVKASFGMTWLNPKEAPLWSDDNHAWWITAAKIQRPQE